MPDFTLCGKYYAILTSFSFSSASRVLNFFCTSLISLNAVFRFVEGAVFVPGSLRFVLRNTLQEKRSKPPLTGIQLIIEIFRTIMHLIYCEEERIR